MPFASTQGKGSSETLWESEEDEETSSPQDRSKAEAIKEVARSVLFMLPIVDDSKKTYYQNGFLRKTFPVSFWCEKITSPLYFSS